jgi:cobalt-zinc-cadmium efflux system protein
VALALNLLLTVVQVIGGVVSGSLALLADALHNFGDCGSLLIALVARRWSRKGADRWRTFGYKRAEVVGAVINLTALIVVAFYLVIEAVERAIFPPEKIQGLTVIIVASVALAVDLGTVLLLWTMQDRSMNLRAAMLHNLSDALASIGVIIVGVAVMLWDFKLADVLITLLIAGYVLWQSVGMLRRSIGILMNSAPVAVDLEELAAAIAAVPQVCSVHHVHLWELDEHEASLEAHVVILREDAAEMERVKDEIKRVLAERFSITHSTLEFELDGHAACEQANLIAEH